MVSKDTQSMVTLSTQTPSSAKNVYDDTYVITDTKALGLNLNA